MATPRVPRETRACAACGKAIERTAREFERAEHPVCNKQCQGALQKGAPSPRKVKSELILVHCAACGKEIRRPSWRLSKGGNAYCNTTCRNDGLGTARSKRLVTETCDGCGKEYQRDPAKYADEPEKTYCSNDCRMPGHKFGMVNYMPEVRPYRRWPEPPRPPAVETVRKEIRSRFAAVKAGWEK